MPTRERRAKALGITVDQLPDNPINQPRMIAEALKEKWGAVRVVISIHMPGGNSLNYEAK